MKPTTMPRLLYVGACIALYPVLAVTYVELVFPSNEYLGFALSPELPRIAEAIVLIALAALVVPLDARRPSAFMAQVLVVAALVPTAVYFGLASQPRSAMYAIWSGVLACILTTRSRLRIRLPDLIRGPYVALAAALLATSAVVAFDLITYGPPRLRLDLYTVYELRLEATESGRLGYIPVWVSGVFNPLLIAYCVERRELFGVTLAIAAQCLLFLYTGSKVALFQPLLVVGIRAVYSMSNPAVWLPTAVWCLAFALIIVGRMDRSIGEVLSDFSVRRVLFVPAFLNFGYFDFFSTRPKVFLTTSFLTGILDYPYGETSTGQLVADHLGLGKANATNGFLATGFMHFGYPGVLAFGCVAGFLMKLLDSMAVRSSAWLVSAVAIGPYRAFMTESDIPTSLVTHGGLAVLALLWLLNGPKTPSARNCPRDVGSA